MLLTVQVDTDWSSISSVRIADQVARDLGGEGLVDLGLAGWLMS